MRLDQSSAFLVRHSWVHLQGATASIESGSFLERSVMSLHGADELRT